MITYNAKWVLYYFISQIRSGYVDDEIPGFSIFTGYSVDVKIDGGTRICIEIVLKWHF